MVDWARARRASRSSPPARAPSTCPPTTHRRPTPSGRTTAVTPTDVAAGGFNAQMFNSLPRRHQERDRDGGGRQRDRPHAGAATASTFPPCGVDDLPRVLRPQRRRRRAASPRPGRGDLERSSATARRCSAICAGASTSRFAADSETTCAAASASTASSPTPSGDYSAMYKPYHLIGLELGISVASRSALRGEPTGAARGWQRRRRRHRQARPAAPARRSTAKAATRCTAS